MNLSAIRWALVPGVAVAMAAAALAQEYAQDYNEEKITPEQVPATVRAKGEEAAKGVRFAQAFQDNNKAYRLVGKNAEGALVIVYATEKGDLLSVTTRKTTEEKKVPKAVAKAFDAERKKNRQLKGFKTATVERADVYVAAKDKTRHVYQYRGRNAEKLPVEVDVSEDGQVEKAGIVLVHPDANRPERKGVQLPPAVLEGIQQALPGVRITDAVEQNTQGGLASFLVTGKNADGRRVTADVNPNGTVVTVKYDLSAREMPGEAVDLLQQKMELESSLVGFRPQKYQRLELRQLPGGGALVYAFLGKNTKGDAYEVRVFADGSDVTIVPASAKDLSAAPKDEPADAAKAKTAAKKTGRAKRKSR
jgi:hypothetical protein